MGCDMMDSFFLFQYMTLSFIQLHFPIDPGKIFKIYYGTNFTWDS